MEKVSYCGRCKRCVRLYELFLPIQAEKEEERKNKNLLESTNKQAVLK